jgi:hypothetical protein
MKKIHFNHLRFKNWCTLIIALAFICVIAGFFELFPFHNEKNHSKVSALGSLLTAIYYSKMFWYRNYVEWNKLGMNIKLNKWTSKAITFNEVKNVTLSDTILKITGKSQVEHLFQIQSIEPQDVKKLVAIIEDYAGLKCTL